MMRIGALLLGLWWSGAALAVDAQQRERVELRLADGRMLHAELRRPAMAAHPLPVVLLFGGFRGAATVLDAVPAELPLIAASFDYPFDRSGAVRGQAAGAQLRGGVVAGRVFKNHAKTAKDAKKQKDQ